MNDFHKINVRLAAAFHPLKSKLAQKENQKFNAARVKIRQRGTALVETEQGILLVSEDGVRFSLPGGAANRDELLIEAAIRELREETQLCAYSAKYLFSHLGDIRRRGTGYSRNHHHVFLIEAEGVPSPNQEIKAIQFYRSGSAIKISNSTRKILNKYYSATHIG
jgi:ADP-ribose pyrophosphatase YjhB (NUDIX family)